MLRTLLSSGLPYAVIIMGVVVATLITAIISLTTLLVSKEDKVSDSRQRWLEGLREETAKSQGGIDTLLRLWEEASAKQPNVGREIPDLPQSNVPARPPNVGREIPDLQSNVPARRPPDLADFRHEYRELYKDINETLCRVLLYLDPEDLKKSDLHKAIITKTDQMKSKFYGDCKPSDIIAVRELQKGIIKDTQLLIKHTWGRVKKGGLYLIFLAMR
jgi:hypothetical protein